MFTLRRRRTLACLVLAGAAISSTAALAGGGAAAQAAARASAPSVAVARALSYLHRHQTKAGGFRVSSTAEQTPMTPWCVLAIAAAGYSPTSWHVAGGRSPIAYLQSVDLERYATSMSGSAANGPAFYAKVILAYSAARQTALIGRAGSKRIDLVAKLLRYRDSSSGRFTPRLHGAGNAAAVNTTTWAIFALKAAGRAATARAKAVAWLKTQAAGSGGFSWTPGGAVDVDSTATAVQALRAGGVSSSAGVVRRALSYLRTQQRAGGGFVSGFAGSTNTESTALAIQAIIAAGGHPSSASWRKGGKSPLDYIRAHQAASGLIYHLGHIAGDAPLMTSAQAVIALCGEPFPF